MKYCSHCGSEIHDEAVICVRCGCSVESNRQVPVNCKDDTLITVVKVFMILGCIVEGASCFLIPLAWCIPMTITVFNRLRDRQPISTGMKVCVLLFVNIVAGICLLCMDDNK